MLQTPELAAQCIAFGNALPCANDPQCGPFLLTVLNCSCADPSGIPYSRVNNCYRINPLKDRAPVGVTQCQRLP